MEEQNITGAEQENTPTLRDAGGEAPARNIGEEFDALIKGDYKEEYTRRTQALIDRRFKQTKELETRLADYRQLCDRLSDRYGTPREDLQALTAALETEPLPTEAASAQALEETYRTLHLQARRAQAYYPALDVEKELENPAFATLLRRGTDIKTAYETVHRRELLSYALQKAARRSAQAVVQNIRARGLRPAENGLAAHSTAIGRPDVRSLTKAQREEIGRRVLKGERITF